MIVIHGRKTARIKSFTDMHEPCPDCKNFGVNVKVYNEYYHIYYIPFMPIGDKEATMHCITCGNPIRHYEKQKAYAATARKPFYLHSFILLLLATVVAVIIAANINGRQEQNYAAEPRANDTYRIREEKDGATTYYFLKVAAVAPDSVSLYSGDLGYTGFVSRPDAQDRFLPESAFKLSRSTIIKMQEDGTINSIERN